MPRTYSQPFVLGVQQGDQRHPGTRLALACIRGNLPAVHVAKVLGVSRVTLFSWFRGKTIRSKDIVPTIEALTTLIEHDLKMGVLPVNNSSTAKKYLAGVAGYDV